MKSCAHKANFLGIAQSIVYILKEQGQNYYFFNCVIKRIRKTTKGTKKKCRKILCIKAQELFEINLPF